MSRRPGRPRTKPDGVRISVYLSKAKVEKIDKHVSAKVSRSQIVEGLISIGLDGREEYVKKLAELEELRARVRDLEKENDTLKKERDYFKNKAEKMETKFEELKAKWKGQTKIDKYVRKSEEMKVLAERIQEHIAEGKTWGDVMQELGILERGDMVDIFKKLWLQRDEDYISTVVPGWKLKDHSGNRRGIFGYVFKREENEHGTPVRMAEVST